MHNNNMLRNLYIHLICIFIAACVKLYLGRKVLMIHDRRHSPHKESDGIKK